MGKSIKVVILSEEVGKFGKKVELPDNAETRKLISEGKVQEVK